MTTGRIMANYEVISAFLDNESFSSEELKHALADSEGRALLIELIGLRRIVQPDAVGATRAISPRRPLFRVAVAAAGIAMAVVGGYQLGSHDGGPTVTAPEPTRVIAPAATWQESTEGTLR